LRLLDSEKIEYLLIGGYAVGIHGYVRGTKDMDVWVAIHPENLRRLIEALVKFGFARESLSPDLFTTKETVFRMGVPPAQLEILTQVSGVEFADCYSRRVMVPFEDLTLSVISYDDLRRNKLASGRAQDIADVQKLEKRRQR
jgi:hypothetical protein